MSQYHHEHSVFNARIIISLNTQSGILFIEYMLAMSIGMIILYCVFEVYQGIKLGHRFIQEIVQSYNEADTVIDLINREVSVSGRMGCEVINDNHLLYDNITQHYINFPPMIVNQQKIIMTHTKSDYALLSNNASLGKSFLDIDSNPSLHQGDLIVMSDCVHTEINRVSDIYQHHQGVRLYVAYPLHADFSKDTMVAKVVTVEIRLENHKKKNTLYLIINDQRTPVSERINNLIFEKQDPHAVHFQFDVYIRGAKRTWYGYAKAKS